MFKNPFGRLRRRNADKFKRLLPTAISGAGDESNFVHSLGQILPHCRITATARTTTTMAMASHTTTKTMMMPVGTMNITSTPVPIGTHTSGSLALR